MFEGTGKYFLMLFIVLFIVYLTVKVCLGKLFKEMKINPSKAYIPFYNRLVLINKLDMKKNVFYKTLIPFYNLYIYKIIIGELLRAYKMDPKDAVWYVVFPMYKFPELVFKHPKYMLHMYDDTEEFIVNQNVLFEKESDKHINSSANQQTNDVIINPESYNQINNTVNEEPQMNVYNENDNVFLNESLQPDERQETVIEAKKQEIKPEEKPIVVDKSKPKVCQKCGTKLSPTATTCFLCGTKLL